MGTQIKIEQDRNSKGTCWLWLNIEFLFPENKSKHDPAADCKEEEIMAQKVISSQKRRNPLGFDIWKEGWLPCLQCTKVEVDTGGFSLSCFVLSLVAMLFVTEQKIRKKLDHFLEIGPFSD